MEQMTIHTLLGKAIETVQPEKKEEYGNDEWLALSGRIKDATQTVEDIPINWLCK